jgi:hypothetical protein
MYVMEVVIGDSENILAEDVEEVEDKCRVDFNQLIDVYPSLVGHI